MKSCRDQSKRSKPPTRSPFLIFGTRSTTRLTSTLSSKYCLSRHSVSTITWCCTDHLKNVHLAGPFFTFFIPLFYYFQGSRWPDPTLVFFSFHTVAVSTFCESSRATISHRSLTCAFSQGSRSGAPVSIGTRATYSLDLLAWTGATSLSSLPEARQVLGS